ncbi:MAG: PACE efflux transporter [Desulfobacteraceae bacterium]|nr:PACE efflux transporter [Desulfobacteraceae bacterium]
MRTFKGRVVHTLLFELFLMGICTPLIALIFNMSLGHIGLLSLGLSITAMICNGLYNYAFDRALLSMKRPLYPRSFYFRCFHSILFEVCLMVITLPMIMCWMKLPFFQALVMDLSFSMIVPVYALIFNWVYDLVFPAPLISA